MRKIVFILLKKTLFITLFLKIGYAQNDLNNTQWLIDSLVIWEKFNEGNIIKADLPLEDHILKQKFKKSSGEYLGGDGNDNRLTEGFVNEICINFSSFKLSFSSRKLDGKTIHKKEEQLDDYYRYGIVFKKNKMLIIVPDLHLKFYVDYKITNKNTISFEQKIGIWSECNAKRYKKMEYSLVNHNLILRETGEDSSETYFYYFSTLQDTDTIDMKCDYKKYIKSNRCFILEAPSDFTLKGIENAIK